MHRTSSLIIILLVLLLLPACRSGPPVAPTGEATASGRPSPAGSETAATPTPTPPGGQIFAPVVPGGEPTGDQPTAAYPALPVATGTPAAPTPVVPTPTPEPEYPVYTGPPLNRDEIGIQIYLHRQDVRDLLRHLEALDVGWVKVQVSWKLHEPRPGEYNEELFGELDRLIDGANGQNVKVLLSVSKAPEWSRPTTEMDGPPSDYALFEGFMRYLATRYTGKVAAYELWNEPNLQREWNGTPLSAADLVELIRRGAAGVRAVDPAALIISAAPATTGINDGVNAIDDRVYFGGMLAAGVASVIDGAGVHPYGWANPPDSRAADATQVSSSHNNHPSFFFADTLEDYRAMLVAAGAADIELWPTEFGWGTFEGLLTDEGQPASPPPGSEFMADNTEWEQAIYTLRAFEMGHEREWVGPMFLWNLNFTKALGPEFQEVGYSLLRFDDSRRPVYRALERRGE
ncbi:MAG TPA: cellulase family glycosylhydrolase [Promineifilum sp.]|nr:cellulase family glycosylhydrolase [Promineifilum sp.]HRQ13138.1 cellulase family glycosylhydrolase [Promineifilum sp.]